MAHLASNRYNYWGQFALLLGLCGAGLIIGIVASLVPLMGKINITDFIGSSASTMMDKLLKPENATALRWSQFISTTFLFFLPSVLYARICHAKAYTHLGFNKNIDVRQVGLVLLMIVASLPMVSALQELTELLPWGKATLLQFKEAEEAYNKQVAVIARMDNFFDYIISVIVIAFLPALFEETLFRGAIQNLFSRWFKMPIFAIVLTAIIFSAIHGSYLGFLSRFVLGFLLGWLYYRTGNIWLNIVAHFINNAMAVTALYVSTKPGKKVDISNMDENFPLWTGLVSILLVIGLMLYFEKIAKKDIDRPGEEVLLPGFDNRGNPFLPNSPNAEISSQ